MGRAFIARASAGKAGRHTHTVVHVCNWTNVQARACNACIHGWDEGETGEAVGGTGKGAGTGVRACMCALMCDTRERRTEVWVGPSKGAYLIVRACVRARVGRSRISLLTHLSAACSPTSPSSSPVSPTITAATSLLTRLTACLFTPSAP